MGNQLIAVETSRISPAARAAFWGNALSQLCGRLHASAYGGPTLDGAIEYGALGRVKLCQIEASPHRVGLSKELAKTEPHKVIKVVFQLTGNSLYEQDGEAVMIAPGECLVYDVSRPHLVTSAAQTRHLVAIIPKDLISLRDLDLRSLSAQRFSASNGIGRLANDAFNSTYQEMTTIREGCADEVADALVNMLLLPLTQNRQNRFDLSPTAQRGRQIKTFIGKNLRDPDLSIERIAAAMGCTKRYLHMAFETEGTTIAEYIWQARLEECRRSLEKNRDSDLTITEIAYSWGFNSSSHFSRCFKKKFGIAPSDLRGRAGRTA